MVYDVPDFPKLECPFVRKEYEIDKSDWKKYGSVLQLREPVVYLVTPQVNSGYEWVIEDNDTIAIEKLHGTNVSVLTENKRMLQIQNRKNVIDPMLLNGGRSHIIEGIFNSVSKGYIEDGCLQFGECLGPKVNGNIYGLPHHLWYPFQKAKESLRYKSFHTHERGFLQFSEWFRLYLKSMFYCRYNKIPLSSMFSDEVPFAEGVVFYNGKRMAKLRRDMYPWYYWDRIKIHGLEDYWGECAAVCGVSL